MIDTGITIKLYPFAELSDKAKEKAIEQHRQFELEIMQPKDFISGDPQYDTPEELQKAYEAEFKYYEENDEPIIENIEANEYLFFASGELAKTVQYCGNSLLKGETHFKFDGVDYLIQKEM